MISNAERLIGHPEIKYRWRKWASMEEGAMSVSYVSVLEEVALRTRPGSSAGFEFFTLSLS